MQLFSVGIIGAGNVVSSVHLPALKAMKDIRVCWIADLIPERARVLARCYGLAHVNLDHGLDQLPHADVILLAVPYGARGPYYDELRKRSNTALFVEKPLARTIAEHNRICEMYEPHRVACGLSRRAWAPVQMLKQLIESRFFGRPTACQIGLGNLGGISTGGSYTGNSTLTGGGVLIEVGVHCIDTILYCMGATAVRVDSGRSIQRSGFDLHTEARLMITSSQADTVPCDLKVTVLENTANRIQVCFETVGLSLSLFTENPAIEVGNFRGQNAYKLIARNGGYPSKPSSALVEFWRNFLGGLRTGTVNYTCATTSLLTTQAIEQLYALPTDA